jgi:hypothetical protein
MSIATRKLTTTGRYPTSRHSRFLRSRLPRSFSTPIPFFFQYILCYYCSPGLSFLPKSTCLSWAVPTPNSTHSFRATSTIITPCAGITRCGPTVPEADSEYFTSPSNCKKEPTRILQRHHNTRPGSRRIFDAIAETNTRICFETATCSDRVQALALRRTPRSYRGKLAILLTFHNIHLSLSSNLQSRSRSSAITKACYVVQDCCSGPRGEVYAPAS